MLFSDLQLKLKMSIILFSDGGSFVIVIFFSYLSSQTCSHDCKVGTNEFGFVISCGIALSNMPNNRKKP